MLQKLNRKTANVPRTHPVKVLQFGEGNFLRAFVDWMVDILNEKTDFNGAVEIIQPLEKGMAEVLKIQDGLFHVMLKGLQHGQVYSNIRMVTCVSNAINPYDDFKAFLATGENPDLKFLVSNTTEAGIAFDPADARPLLLSQSFPGKVTQLLYHRFQFFTGDLTKGLYFLPCELIEKNGDQLKETILKYAEDWKLPSDFAKWVTSANVFCNTLVDRIVPGFPRETIAEIQESIGYEDNLVVQAEPFHLWVIESPVEIRKHFPADQAGLDVKFVSDLTPYRTRKVRILNGAHTALVPVAYLAGFRTVMDSVNDEAIGTYIRKVIFDEIIPTLDLPADELKQFANDVIERFKNPFIKHELLSIALNSISKFKVRVLPSLLEYYKRKGVLPENMINSLAALLRFYKGEWNGAAIPLNDSKDVLDFFKSTWENDDGIAKKVLEQKSFWGQDLTQITGLSEQLESALIQTEKRAGFA